MNKIFITITILAFVFYSCSNLKEQECNIIRFNPSKKTMDWKMRMDSTDKSTFGFSFISLDTLSPFDTLRVKTFLANNTLKLSKNEKTKITYVISNSQWYSIDDKKWKSMKVYNDTGYLSLATYSNFYFIDSIVNYNFIAKITTHLNNDKDSSFIVETPLVFKK